MVASKGLREWWDEEQGKLAFMPEIQTLFDKKLSDTQNPPLQFNQFWSIFNAESWQI